MVSRLRSLRKREAKQLLASLSEHYDIDPGSKVEVGELADRRVVLLNGRVEFLVEGDHYVPFLGGSHVGELPRVVVDMGAVPYVCGGADVMAPGVVEVDDFRAGDLVAVVDVNHGKALAVGRALVDGVEVEGLGRGKVVENLHYVGDRVWRASA